MNKGIIYVMSTVVPGLIKLGKTSSDNFESRMYILERNGYSNVAGLKRKFAIELEDYDKKEKLLDEIFSKSRVPNTELFALDIDLVIHLLSSFEGKQIYPEQSQETRNDLLAFEFSTIIKLKFQLINYFVVDGEVVFFTREGGVFNFLVVKLEGFVHFLAY